MNIVGMFEFEMRFTRGPGCWIWEGPLDKDGYGRAQWGGKSIKAHRMSYELYRGPIPKGLLVLHKCPGGANPSGVNPSHLEVGTTQENTKDRDLSGTTNKGEEHFRTTLSASSVREMREKYSTGLYYIADIARMYAIPHGTACNIIHRRTWKHI